MAFRTACPGGCIVSEIVQLNDDCDEVVFKATVFDDEGKVIAVGHAHERAADSYINKLSMIENCETSAIGRALGLCGFGVASGGLASYDEMVKAGAANTKPTTSDECAIIKEKLNALTSSLVSEGVEKKTITAKIKEIAGIVNYNKITDVSVLDKTLKALEELKQ